MGILSNKWLGNYLAIIVLCVGILPGTGGCGGSTRGTGGSRANISGSVTQARTGLPVANAEVTIVQTGETVTTDENGFFRIADSSFVGGLLQLQVNGAVAEVGQISAEAREISVELQLEDDGTITTVSFDVDGVNTEVNDSSTPTGRPTPESDPTPTTPEDPATPPDVTPNPTPEPPGGDNPGDDPSGDTPQPPLPTPTPNPTNPPAPDPDGDGNPPPPNPTPPPVAPQQEFIQLPEDRIFNPIQLDASQGLEAYVPVKDGLYSDTTLWSAPPQQSQNRASLQGRSISNSLPEDGSQIVIPEGRTVTVDGIFEETVSAIAVYGTLRFDPSVNTKLKVGTLLVYPQGTLEIGSASQSILAGALAEIEIANQDIASKDTEATGTGIVVLGKIVVHGSEANHNWIRLAREVKAGDRELVLEQAPENWSVGDELVLPDSRLVLKELNETESWSEKARIAEVEGNSIILAEPVQFDHLGAKDLSGQIQYLPHVARLSRNVLIHSENPEGTRGYVYLGDRAEVDIRNARFQNLGRTDFHEASTESAVFEFTERHVATGDIFVFTFKSGQVSQAAGNPTYASRWYFAYRNGRIDVWDRFRRRQEMELLGVRIAEQGNNQITRYAVTMKDLLGPENPDNVGYQFHFVGNTVDGSKMFGIGVVDSHFGLIENNVVFDAKGAGIAFREGIERGNDVFNNIVIRVDGDGDIPRNTPELGHLARSGAGIWQNNPKNNLRNNVSADTRFAGFEFRGRPMPGGYSYLLPVARGVDKMLAGQGVELAEVPPGSNESNEAYGRTVYGFWGSNRYGPDTYITNPTAWNARRAGIALGYPMNIKIEGFQLACDANTVYSRDPGRIAPWHYLPIGIETSGAWGGDLELKYGSISGCQTGIILRNTYSASSGISTRVSDTYLNNYENIVVRTPDGPNSFELNSILSEHPSVPDFSSERPKRAFVMKFSPSRMNFIAPGKTTVNDFQGVQGNSFSLYYAEQSPAFPLPDFTGHTGYQELPMGRSNQFYWDNYGIAIAGGVTPCFETRPDIAGFVCPPSD